MVGEPGVPPLERPANRLVCEPPEGNRISARSRTNEFQGSSRLPTTRPVVRGNPRYAQILQQLLQKSGAATLIVVEEMQDGSTNPQAATFCGVTRAGKTLMRGRRCRG